MGAGGWGVKGNSFHWVNVQRKSNEKQSHEACAVRAKLEIIKGEGTSLVKSGKGWDWGRAQDLGKARKEIGSFERKPALSQTQGNIWDLDKELSSASSLEHLHALPSLHQYFLPSFLLNCKVHKSLATREAAIRGRGLSFCFFLSSIHYPIACPL